MIDKLFSKNSLSHDPSALWDIMQLGLMDLVW